MIHGVNNKLKEGIMKKIIYLFAVLLLAFGALRAEVPMMISLQGLLTDNEGEAIADGVYTINIALYGSEDAVNSFYSTDEDVEVRFGRYSALLDISQLNAEDLDGEIWVGVTAPGGEEMKPRLLISSVPFSVRSALSDRSTESGHAEKADTSGFARAAAKSDSSLYSGHARYSDTADFSRDTPSEIPAGCIFPYAGKAGMIPEGWMLCDGAAMNSKKYPMLYQNMGAAWGDGSDDEDDETDFNLPDLRGMFLRGVDEGAGNDPDADARQACKAGGNSGDNIGSVQEDETGGPGDNQWSFGRSSGMTVKSLTVPNNEGSTVSYESSGGNETRPVNAYVYYIIKVK